MTNDTKLLRLAQENKSNPPPPPKKKPIRKKGI